MAETTNAAPAEVLNGQPEQASGDFFDQASKDEKNMEELTKSGSIKETIEPEIKENNPTKVMADSLKEPQETEVSTKNANVEQQQDAKQDSTAEQEVSGTTETPAEDKAEDQKPADKEPEEKEPEYQDILGSGALLKKVIKKGTGTKPRMGDRVTIRWTKKIPALGKNFPTEELTFIAGDGDVVQALDLIVVLTNEGDEVEVKASNRFMYGEIGLPPDVPPKADFEFTAELLENKGPVDYDKMDFDARFSEAQLKKERGNFLFKRKEYSLALTSYRTASKIVDPDQGCVYPDASPEKLQELLEFRAVVLCNTSVSQLRCDAHEAAVKSALEATKLSPSYSKAYFRLGQAYEKKGLVDETIRAFKTALKFDPENSKLLHGELARLTKVNKKAKESEQKMYSKMFWGDKPPEMNKSENKEDISWFSWIWRGAVGAGIVGMTLGLYKYMNH